MKTKQHWYIVINETPDFLWILPNFPLHSAVMLLCLLCLMVRCPSTPLSITYFVFHDLDSLKEWFIVSFWLVPREWITGTEEWKWEEQKYVIENRVIVFHYLQNLVCILHSQHISAEELNSHTGQHGSRIWDLICSRNTTLPNKQWAITKAKPFLEYDILKI